MLLCVGVNFKQSTGSFDIPLLIFLFVLLQVEDAMLMFDKTTNRHRGKSPFVLCVYLFVPLRVCNVVRNVHQLYYAISCAVHSCTLKTLKREFSVAVQELLCCVLHYSIISSRTFHLSPEGQG